MSKVLISPWSMSTLPVTTKSSNSILKFMILSEDFIQTSEILVTIDFPFRLTIDGSFVIVRVSANLALASIDASKNSISLSVGNEAPVSDFFHWTLVNVTSPLMEVNASVKVLSAVK